MKAYVPDRHNPAGEAAEPSALTSADEREPCPRGHVLNDLINRPTVGVHVVDELRIPEGGHPAVDVRVGPAPASLTASA